MSKYNIRDVVRYTKKPSLYVITQINEGTSYLEYSIMLKTAFDNWIPEKLETFPKENEIFNSISEDEISKI
jgi:hypothetical protein